MIISKLGIVIIGFFVVSLTGCNSGPKRVGLNSSNYHLILDIQAHDEVSGNKHTISVSVSSKNPDLEFDGFCTAKVYVDYYYLKNNVWDMGSCNFLISLDSTGSGESTTKYANGQYTPTCDDLKILRAEPETALKGAFNGTVIVPSGDKTDYNPLDFPVVFKGLDGSVLYETTAHYEGNAVYKGPTPTKASQGYTAYEFRGWDKSIDWVTSARTCLPTFNEVKDESDPEYSNAEFMWKEVSDGYELSKFTSIARYDTIIIPSTHEGRPVVSIGDKAFYDKSNFNGIRFGANLKRIGESAFNGANIITDLNLPEGLESIEKNAFKGNYYIKSINLPSTLKSIGDYAFEGVGWRKTSNQFNVRIPKSVNSMGKLVFYSCDIISAIYCEASSKPGGWDKYWGVKDGYYSSTFESDYTFHTVYWNS